MQYIIYLYNYSCWHKIIILNTNAITLGTIRTYPVLYVVTHNLPAVEVESLVKLLVFGGEISWGANRFGGGLSEDGDNLESCLFSLRSWASRVANISATLSITLSSVK